MQLVFIIIFSYASINVLSAPKIDSLATLTDAYSKYKLDEIPKGDEGNRSFVGQISPSDAFHNSGQSNSE